MSPDPTPTPTRQLLSAVRAWAAANYPGCPVEYLTIHLRFLPVPIQLADSPAVNTSAAAGEVEAVNGESEPFSQCIVDILDVLEAACRPLTETKLLAELARAGKEWGRTTVERYLKMMMEDGTIENPKGAKPPGYRLPEPPPSTSTHL